MAERSPVETTLRSLVQCHPLVARGLLVGGLDGEAAARAVRLWAGQQYFMSISLSQCFAAIYSRAPLTDWQARSPLLDLLLEEAWGQPTCTHGRAFLAFFRSIGGDEAELATAVPMPETLRAARVRLAIAQGSDGGGLAAGALALAFGNEYANIFVFSRLRKSVSRLFPEADLAYFEEHVRDEREHSAALVAIGRLGADAGDHASAERATTALLDARWGFFEAIVREAAARESSDTPLASAAC